MGRQFGLVADPILAGTGYDDLPVGKAIPAPVQSWPVTNVTVSQGATVRERTDEIRGGRGTAAPLPSQRAPSVTVSGRAYPELLATLLYMALGATSRTGTAPAAFTDKLLPAADSALQLPGAHLSWEMDGLFEQMAGAKLNRLNVTFPLTEDATFEATFVGRWHTPLAVAPSWAPSFTWLGPVEWPLQLRDAATFENGSATAIDCLRAFSIEIPDIYREADWCARKNREDIGTGAAMRRIWWPGGYRLAPRRTINGTLELRGLDQARETKMRVLKAEQLVTEIDARQLATTPASTELFRFTLFNAVQQLSGDRAMNRDDDLNTTVNWTAHLDATGKDIQAEYVNNRSTGITVPAT
jgi:hypothetical protein